MKYANDICVVWFSFISTSVFYGLWSGKFLKDKLMANNVISIIMGGGRGTRLYPLTKHRCKPAAPLAGKYRLVDIPISNCINSGFNSIYLLSQFQTASLHKHIQQTYKFDSFGSGFVDILAAEQTDASGDWYQGTADAVRKNMHHFQRHGDNCYYLILSGDQLYQMNFNEMLARHIESNADITIAAKPMPRSEASSLGVMRVNDSLEIIEFAEKPKEKEVIDKFVVGDNLKTNLKNPQGDYCLASMGIYIFSQKVLEEAMSGKEMDFGKEIIPGLLSKKKLCAYIFDGYWEDIGTVGAFFEANLALAEANPDFDFHNQDKPIYTHCRFLPGAKVFGAKIDRANIADGAVVYADSLERCVIGIRSIICDGTSLKNVVMMGADKYESDEEIEVAKAKGIPLIGIGQNCKIENAIIDKNARIGDNCVLSPDGKPDKWEAEGLYVRDGVLIVTKDAVIPSGTKI